MPRTKKTTTEEPKTTTIVETEESIAVDGICIDDKGRAYMESAPNMEGLHFVADWDYKIVPVNDVLKYLYNGYTLHGGPFVRFNEVYQCVILYGTEEVSEAEFEARKEQYKL